MNKRHRKRISIIWKVTLWYTAFLCIMALLIVLITYLVSEQILRNSSKEMLISQVQEVYQDIEYEEGQLEIDDDIDFIEKGIYISIFNSKGRTHVNILVLLVLVPLIIVIAIVGGCILTKRAFKPVKQMSKIRQLLLLARSDLDSNKIQLEWVNLSDLLEVIVEDAKERAQKKNINVHAMIEEGIAIKGDETLLMRFFMNLIMNAINYGKESGNIEIALFRENRGTDKERLAGYVSDDGIGIAEENKEKIWRRFYQVDPSRTVQEEGSLGLVLPMVKWIASVHQAEVWCVSELGVGSTFFFHFPAK